MALKMPVSFHKCFLRIINEGYAFFQSNDGNVFKLSEPGWKTPRYRCYVSGSLYDELKFSVEKKDAADI